MGPDTALKELRAHSPLVHCITNYVAMNIAANVTLAAGASPAMVHAPEEAAGFASICGALTINIGTLSTPWLDGMKAAAGAASQSNIPWVLDPVAHFATPYRGQAVKDLLALNPAIIRGNASEIMALAGLNAGGRGVDSGNSVDDARHAARSLARNHTCTVAVSGAVDFITDGARSATITGGSDIMPKVTALGCSLTALLGAYVSVAPPLDAAVAASVHFAEAGEQTGLTASGPGSFTPAFLDSLYTLQPENLKKERVQWG